METPADRANPAADTDGCTVGRTRNPDDAPAGELVAALAMLERLPLSDDERAEAVRRLLASLTPDT